MLLGRAWSLQVGSPFSGEPSDAVNGGLDTGTPTLRKYTLIRRSRPRRRAVSTAKPPRLPEETGDPETRWRRCNSSHVRCIVSSEAPTSPPRLPRCTAWPLSLNLSSLSWHLVHLSGGHHRWRDLPITFPGEFSSSRLGSGL